MFAYFGKFAADEEGEGGEVAEDDDQGPVAKKRKRVCCSGFLGESFQL